MTRTAPPDHGFYVDLAKTEGGDLEISLNDGGRANFAEIEEARDRYGSQAALCLLLEDHLSDGWEMVPPEDLGALTAAPILSDEIARDDQGEIVEAGRVFCFPDYAVRDEIDELRTNLAVLFQGVP